MDEVISRLSEIEAAADKIIDSAEARKAEIHARMEAQKLAFDKQLALKTQQTISELSEKLIEKKQADLYTLNEKTEQTLKDLDAEYNYNHAALAKQILNQIIGV